MGRREQLVREEAAALWREVFNEPPPKRMDAKTMLETIMHGRGQATYERLRSPFLRPSTIAGPGQPQDDSALG